MSHSGAPLGSFVKDLKFSGFLLKSGQTTLSTALFGVFMFSLKSSSHPGLKTSSHHELKPKPPPFCSHLSLKLKTEGELASQSAPWHLLGEWPACWRVEAGPEEESSGCCRLLVAARDHPLSFPRSSGVTPWQAFGDRVRSSHGLDCRCTC